MTTIAEIVRETEQSIVDNKSREDNLRAQINRIMSAAEADGRSSLTDSEDVRAAAIYRDIEDTKAARRRLNSRLAEARKVQAEEDEFDRLNSESHPNPYLPKNRGAKPSYDEVMRVTSEPHVYGEHNDRQKTGEQFLADVIGSARGNGAATERISRHMTEYERDHPRFVKRAAPDSVSSNFPSLIVPQYLLSEYAASPSNARPFADAMAKRPLPAEGMTVELAVGNTVTTAGLQASELTQAGGSTSFDANPLQLDVQTAESWANVSRQAVERGRITEQIVMNDLLDGMNSLLESTVLTQAQHGLMVVAQRAEWDEAAPTMAKLYPKLIAAASVSQGVLKNRGKPNFVLMHPRRWYWAQAEMTDTWPAFASPGVGEMKSGVASDKPYGQSPNGFIPAGLDVIESFGVPDEMLDGALTGGTEDSLVVGDSRRALLFEAPEVFIRAEQPLASYLGIQIVVYRYFAYSYEQYANAFVAVNGTGTGNWIGPYRAGLCGGFRVFCRPARRVALITEGRLW